MPAISKYRPLEYALVAAFVDDLRHRTAAFLGGLRDGGYAAKTINVYRYACTALIVWQDAGDALHAYIATARPKVDVDKVFLCTNPPWRGFGASNTVGSVARRALNRAGIKTFADRGAHVFRHSQATALLRSGATLDVIQSLLRHRSPNTTAIYAKTDAVMLREIAQPWIGGIEQ